MSFVLADTSIWVQHFRKNNPLLESLLINDRIICHPLVVLEIACGSPPSPRAKTIEQMGLLRQAVLAGTEETLYFIEEYKLFDSGCGAIGQRTAKRYTGLSGSHCRRGFGHHQLRP